MNAGSDDNLSAASYMMLAMFGYGCNDALFKLAATDLPLFQSICVRGLFISVAITLLMSRTDRWIPPLSASDTGTLLLRLSGEVCSTVCFLKALVHMPIASVTAIIQATPIAITLCAALLLGEKIGWRRYTTIVAGFIGVLILIQPGSDDFNRYSQWALAAVAFLVLRDLATRRLSSTIPSLFVTWLTAIAVTLFAAIASTQEQWQIISGQQYVYLAAAAGFLLGGYFFSIAAMRRGDVGFVSPFRYSIMLWAVLLGLFLFGEIPSATTLLGTAIVVASGLYAFYRERKVSTSAAA